MDQETSVNEGVIAMADRPVGAAFSRGWRFKAFLGVFGPGVVVMLADTDVGSIVTAGQSGVQWGYQLLLLQLVLVPILYIVQELTVRLGIFTGKGHGELIRLRFGAPAAWISVGGLLVAAAGALLTEFSGVAGVGELFGVPRPVSLAAAAAFLIAVVSTGSYRRVERVAVMIGLFELAFFGIAIAAHPDLGELARGLVQMPVRDPGYLYLAAANIGAVIMPWMVFYQQSAVVDKGLRPADYRAARWDTAIGALVTQLVMVAALVAVAATIGRSADSTGLNTIGDLAKALTPFLGNGFGRIVFAAGILGAAMISSIVVSLAAAWGIGEVSGYRRSLEHKPFDAPWFYGIYTLCIIVGAVLVAVVPDLVSLNLGVEVMNALLLPLVLGFLVALALRALPEQHRPRGIYLWIVLLVTLLTTGFGVYGGLAGAGIF